MAHLVSFYGDPQYEGFSYRASLNPGLRLVMALICSDHEPIWEFPKTQLGWGF